MGFRSNVILLKKCRDLLQEIKRKTYVDVLLKGRSNCVQIRSELVFVARVRF